MILIFRVIKNEFNQLQIQLEENKIEEIKKYFNDSRIITKEILKPALRTLILLFLSNEKEIENKIKNNYNNISNYLTIPDIWDKNIYNKKEFNQEINKIKNLNIQINQTLELYELLGDDIDENYFSDVKAQIKKNEEMKREKEKEEKKEDMNFPSKDLEEQKQEDEEEKKQEDDDDDDYYDRSDDGDEDEYYGRD